MIFHSKYDYVPNETGESSPGLAGNSIGFQLQTVRQTSRPRPEVWPTVGQKRAQGTVDFYFDAAGRLSGPALARRLVYFSRKVVSNHYPLAPTHTDSPPSLVLAGNERLAEPAPACRERTHRPAAMNSFGSIHVAHKSRASPHADHPPLALPRRYPAYDDARELCTAADLVAFCARVLRASYAWSVLGACRVAV